MATKRIRILGLVSASVLSLTLAAYAASTEKGLTPNKQPTTTQQPTPKPEATPKKGKSSPTQTKQIDLGSKLQNMHLHNGLNLVHSDDGVKLMAQARNNKIVGWSATDEKGNKLPMTAQEQSTTAGGTTVITVTRTAKGSGKKEFLQFKFDTIFTTGP